MDVALFETCLNEQFYPQVGRAVRRVLEHFGCRVHRPPQQTCCGQPFFNNGYTEEARDLAKRMVEIFEPYDHIITPSGSCCAMVRQHFPELLGDDPAWKHGAAKLVASTYEFVEFLTRVLKADLSAVKLPRPETMTYHYSCHLRGLGVKDEPIRLLKQLQNLEFRPLERMDQCCGFGGTFSVKYEPISQALAEDKVRCIAATGAQTTIINDAGCAMTIDIRSKQFGLPTRVKHVAEVIAEGLGIV